MATAPLRHNPFDDLKASHVLLWAVACFFAITLAIVALLQPLGLLNPQEPLFSPVLMLLFYISFGVWLLHYLQQKQIVLPQVWGRRPQTWRWGMLLMLAGLLLLFTLGTFLLYVGLMAWWVPSVGDGIVDSTRQGLLPDRSWFAQLLKLFVVVVAAPLVEELAFRGILLQRWERKWGVNSALICSSVAFGSLHFNPLGMTMFGLVMGLLYIRTRSLAVPTACHVINNVLALTLELLNSTGASSAEADSLMFHNVWLGLLLLGLSLPLLTLFIQRSWPRHQTVMPYIHNGQHNGQANQVNVPRRPLVRF